MSRLLANAAIVISRLHRGEKRLAFCQSRAQAEELGDIPPDVVDEFIGIYKQEEALKARRVALAFPTGMPS